MVACSAARPQRFEVAQHAAERAYSAGRYAEAAEHWLKAADHADSPRDRAEAEYRAAASFERGGRHDDAARLYASLAAKPGERAARAALQRAELERRRGHEERAQSLYLEVVRRHPSSGPAVAALGEHLDWLRRSQGEEGALSAVERLIAELGQSELDERLRYARARLLDELGRTQLARDAYLECARRHPYPKGALWDDALWRAALCEEKLGRPTHAVALLESMLAEREHARVAGSAERGRYAEARFRIAELYRDALGDRARARREFRRVWDEHPTALLRDDALFEEALLARASGDDQGACQALRVLVDEAPESRFVPCAPSLCTALRPHDERECRGYLRRRIEGPAQAEP